MTEPFTGWHVGVAAEAFAAAMFARCGYDVSVQYGANQPEYDLMVARGDQLLKVSVKGSKDGGWGLCQGFLERGKADYHAAIDRWLARHKPRTVFCFVQFEGVALHQMPRLYLATPEEVASRLHDTAAGRGDTTLFERHEWGPRAIAGHNRGDAPHRGSFRNRASRHCSVRPKPCRGSPLPHAIAYLVATHPSDPAELPDNACPRRVDIPDRRGPSASRRRRSRRQPTHRRRRGEFAGIPRRLDRPWS